MNTFKRFFALILTLCMVLSYVPVGAFAAETRTAAEAPAGVSNATEPFPLSLMTNQGNSGGHYRIPAMITLNDGTVVAAADARWQGWDTTDDNGNIDTVVSYSKNNGETWEVGFGNYFTCGTPYAECWGSPTIIDPGLVTDGEKIYMIADLFPGQSNGAGNCSANAQYAVGYDASGRMLLRANANTNDTGYYLYEGKIYASDGTEQEGYTVDAYFNLSLNNTFVRNLFEYSTAESGGFIPVMTPHLYLTVGEFDADGDLVWSEPTMLNPVLRSASEKYYLVSPGRGIKTKDNVLVIGGYGNASGGEKASIIFFDGESWHRSSREASSVSSESEIVELADGTLRMFARHSGNGNYVQYIDWTPVYTDGKVTDYTPSAAVNTTAVAHNNTNVTAIGYSKTYGGKQVILVSCPGDTSSAWTRLNGKIFTFVVDPTTKAMTLVNTVEVNGSGEAYSYSCLTELADGTVGLLYEKGDGGNISYAEYDAEELTGLEFDGNYDIFVDGSNNLTTLTVKVPVSAGVTQIHTKVNNNVAGLTADTYVAYDIVLCKDGEADCDGTGCTATYTGVATVNLPISGELAAQNLKGFVVNGDGSFDYVMDVSVINKDGSYLATFKAPHFSTVGVMPKTPEEIATESKTVTLKVNGTYADTLAGVNLTGSNAGTTSAETALVTWTAVGTETTYPTAQLGVDANYNGDIINLNDCLYTFTKDSSDRWTITAMDKEGKSVYVYPGNTGSAGNPQRRNAYSNLTIANATETNHFTIMSNDMDGTGNTAYLYFDRANRRWDRVAELTNDSWLDDVSLRIYKPVSGQTSGDIIGYERVMNLADIKDGQYLIVGPADDGKLYAMYPSVSNTTRYAQLAKITGNTKTETQYETTVVIEGVAEGTTAVAVGDVRYDITVAGALTEVDVKLEVGETTTIINKDGNFEAHYSDKGLNTATATVQVEGVTIPVSYALGSKVTPGTALTKGDYLLVNIRKNKLASNVVDGSHLTQTARADTISGSTVWHVTPSGSNYTFQDVNKKYMKIGSGNSGLSDSEVLLTLSTSTYNGADTWQIGQNGQLLNDHQGGGVYLAGYGADGDPGSQWDIYTVNTTPESNTTTVVVKAVADGTTSVVVGNTKYNIIVGDDLTDVDVTLKLGETITVTDDTGNFENNVDRTNLDTSIADVAVTGTDGTITRTRANDAASSIKNGSKYIIVNHAKNKVVTNEDASQYAAAGTMIGMKMTGDKDTFGESAVWTIEAVTGGYTVQNSNGKYLSIAHNEVSLSVDPVTLKVEKNGDTWTFGSGSVYLNDAAGGGTCATGWDNGETARTDGGSQWDLYEITETAENFTTTIDITGKAAGETSVVVGHVTYNITVINSTIQVDMMIDDTKNFVIDGGAFDSATNSNDTVASVTVTPDPLTEDTRLRKVTDITSGRKYLIETNRGTPVLLNGTVEGTGLLLSGTKSADSAQVWTIEEFGEGYSVSIEVDGVRKYLSMTRNDEALLVDAPVALRLGKNGALWTISQADCYLNRFGGASGNKAAAWNGGGAATDDGSMWNIYEVVNEDRTNVSIKGLTAGKTTIKVGFMTYEVTVHEKSKDITLLVGESWEGVIDGVAVESGTNSNDLSASFATITWKGITDGVMGHLMNADGSYGNLYEMSNAELTFTKNEDGTWGIVDSTGQHFMTISGQPFGDSQNNTTAISFNEDGTARLSYNYTYDGTSYTSYLRFNTSSFQWAHNHDLNQANSIFDFLIYTPVAEGEESSAEMPGYKKVTNGDQMVSGNNYLIAFVLDGGYYCMTYNPLAGNTYGNLVRVYPTEHTDIKIVGKNVGKTSYEIGGVTYNITVNPFIKTITMEYHEENETFVSPLTGEVSDADIEQFNKTHGAYVTVEKNTKGTELIFTAKAVCDSFEHTLGNITYIIKVTPDLADSEDTDYVGGQNGSKGKNQPITGLIISTATSYDLNVDTTDMPAGTTIKWVSSDSDLFVVNENGNVTANNTTAGEGFVSVYKVDADGNETLYQTIPVIVLATEKGTNTRLIDFYNEEVLNCTSYYSLSEGELHEFPEGYQIYVRHDKSVADVISFWATPDDGYALTYINGSGGTYFHPVDAGDGINYGTNFEDPNDIPQYVGTDASSQLWAFDQLVASAVKNAGAITITEAISLTKHAVVMRSDGMFFFSRAVNTGDMSSTTIFVAEKLPEVSKSINGVLNTSDPDNPWNWTTYKPGMYAEVGNKVFFTLQLEIEAPIRWDRILDNAHKPIKPEISADDAVVDVEGYVLTRANENSPWVRAEYNGNPYKPAADIGNIIIIDHEGYLVKQDANGRPLAALEYNIGADDGNAELLDNLEDAYFYTKEWDRVGTDYDPNATYENPNKFLDAEIPENLKTRVEDVTAAMNAGWTEAEIEAGKRVLTYYVMYAIKGKDLNKEIVNTVTLDYTHQTTYSKGATVAHADAQASIIVVGEALGDSLIDFGRPIVKDGLTNEQIPGVGVYNEETKTWSYDANRLKAVNELTQNANDSLLYGDAELTYDADNDTYTLTYTPHSILESRDVIYIMVPDGEGGAVLSNYLRVYPATTVYYEETFADLANANSGNDHGWNNVQPSTKTQEFQDLNCDEHDHSNFGFDPSYAKEPGMSNGTQLISKKSGDTATYQFTGTGFELYANADIDTSVLAVLLYRVNTADDGTQTETMVKFYQVVTANKSGDSAATDGQDTIANSLPVVSVSDLPHASYKVVVRHTKPLTDTEDEIRIDGIRIYGTLENGDQYYPDEEQNVIFTELRDEVLTAISGVSTDNCDQVYSQIQTLGEVTVGYLTADTAEDMLKNGPKNEIWMTADDALVFKLSAGVANAQLGLKAPSGAVKCVITIAHADGKQTKIIFTDAEVEQEEDVTYIINKPLTTSTDMFYRLPGDVAGAVVTIEVNEGMLSVTKLKTKMKTNPNIKALAVMDEKSVNTALNILYGYVDENAAQNNVSAKPYDIVNVVSGVHVYWKATEGAVKYGLWRSETGENGTYKWLGNPTVPHFTDTKVESGKTYYYKVTAMDANGKHSDKSEAIGITYVATPDINTRFNKAAGITVGWNKIEGATGYAVYRKLYSGNSEWARVATIEGNETFTWQDTSVKNNNGTAYKYTVRALAGDDLKTLSGCRNAGRSMVRLTSRVLTGAVKASDTAIKCSWTTSSAVTGYEIRFMIGNEVFKTFTVGNYKTGVKTFTGLKAGQTYKVQVRSYVKIDGMGFYSAWSAPKYANTLRTLTFADIPSSYYFSSGVGAWGTGLDIKADGTMSGSFHDSNMGETGTGYPNGTVYTCSFSGKFSAPEAVNAYVYKMTLESLTTENPAGHVEIKDGVRYVAGDAYGIDGEKVFYIYLPGTPKDMLPEDVYNWVWRSYGEDALKDSYIICGESNAHPFVS